MNIHHALLVVADDELCRFMELVLRRYCARVDIAPSNYASMKRLISAQNPPELVVVDVDATDICRFPLLNILHTQPRFGDVKVITINSMPSASQFACADEIGVDVILTKPFTYLEIQAALHQTLGVRA